MNETADNEIVLQTNGGGPGPTSIKRHGRVSSILVHGILLILASFVILPLVLPFFFVFKTPLEFAFDPWGLPKQLMLDNFKEAWEFVQIGQGLVNSFIVCAGAILVTVPCAAMAGYVFARYRTRLTDIAFYVIMTGFFIPAQMVLIPLVRLDVNLGLINTLPGLFLPMSAFGIPFWTMIYRSFFRTIPQDLTEAARIDGAGHWRTFVRIVLPLAKPATMLAVMLTFFGAWNDYLLSLVIINSQDLFTMQLRVVQLMGGFGANFFPQYASGLLISLAPTVFLYIVFHKKIIEGVTLQGAIKG